MESETLMRSSGEATTYGVRAAVGAVLHFVFDQMRSPRPMHAMDGEVQRNEGVSDDRVQEVPQSWVEHARCA